MKTTKTAFSTTAIIITLVALATVCAAAEQPQKIPFTLFHGSNIVVSVDAGSGKTLPFVFDSGISHGNILSTETAKALGMESSGKARFTDSAGHHGVTGVATLPSIKLGNTQLQKQTFAITHVPTPMKARQGKPPIAGFLGPPLMQNAVLCIDYQHQVLRRWKLSEFDDTGLASTAMPLNHGLATIRIKIDGVAAALAVDTGNDGGVELFPAFVKPHSLIDKYPDLEPLATRSGSGHVSHALRGTAKTVEVGSGTTLKNVPLLFISQALNPAWGIDGFVGYKFLKRLNPCMNRSAQRMLWAPGSQ